MLHLCTAGHLSYVGQLLKPLDHMYIRAIANYLVRWC